MMTTYTTLSVLLPGFSALFAALVAYMLKGNLADKVAQGITTAGVLLSALLAWVVFISLNNGAVGGESQWFPWLTVANWQVGFGVMVDKLTATMLIVVTSVSACVHVYSWGYMADDASKRRFFIYLSAFTFAMLMLVSAPNLIQMFLGWEGVGVCSYLLIGFWHHKESANAAAMKAFLVNRVADGALLLGLFTLLTAFGSLNYADILPRVGDFANHVTVFFGHEVSTLTLAAALIFIGAMGKSAQLGLHTWLPDAMEGPTPVSALIHAATMVTAGVFLLCRLSPLYEMAPAVLHVVAWVGALTALFAATVGLTQRDIKRVIAYSTCSQLGFMFFAIGVSAYPAAMFHLTTHAFFKALLFMGAGSVIHGLHHEQNLFNMGGIRKALPITYGLMWLGTLALCGIPLFAGFFSKELILESAFMAPDGSGWAIYLIGTISAMLTAVYSTRVMFRAFHGEDESHGHHHPHESPWSMIGPMIPLAFGAVLGGWLLKDMGTQEWWQGAIVIDHHHDALHAAHHIPIIPKFIPLILSICGITFSYYAFVWGRRKMREMAESATIPYAISFNKWYFDELYETIFVKPVKVLAHTFHIIGDKLIIDHVLVNGTARTFKDFGLWLKGLHTGRVYHYAYVMILMLTAMLAWMLWKIWM